MKEIWKDIEGFEGEYQASSFGRIKSLSRYIIGGTGKRLIPERIIKYAIDKGYYRASLFHNGKRNNLKSVARIIATVFVPNPENKPCVNHKDGNKLNNYANNLEWNTYSENELHSYRVLGKKPVLNRLGKSGKQSPRSKPVICLNTNDYFDNATIAAKKLGLIQSSVSAVCIGKRKHTGGYLFKFAE